jgi:hypothetical protein
MYSFRSEYMIPSPILFLILFPSQFVKIIPMDIIGDQGWKIFYLKLPVSPRCRDLAHTSREETSL